MVINIGENHDNIDIVIISLHRNLGDTDIASFQYCGITIIPWNHTVLLVSKLVEKSTKYEILKLHNYLMEGFRIDLKTFLGLAMPHQCSQTIRK